MVGVGMGDWLGTGTIVPRLRKYSPFQQARAFVRKLKLQNQREWIAYCKGEMPHLGRLPEDIPANPHKRYAQSGWEGLGDWLGTGVIAMRFKKYRSFSEVRAFVQKLNLNNRSEWKAFCKGEIFGIGRLPEDIPAAPWLQYAETGWESMGDWLGTGNIASFLRQYRPFEQARAYAQKLNLNSRTEWSAFCKDQRSQLEKLPADIPAVPSQTYADKGWSGWGDWLGTGRTRVSKSAKRKST